MAGQAANPGIPVGAGAFISVLSQGEDTFTGAVNADALLTVSGISDDKLPAIIDAVKSSDATLGNDPAVAAVNALLPADRLAVMYFREPGAPATDPLIGMTAGTSDSAVRADMYISGATATQLVQQATKLFQEFGGGPTPAPTDNTPVTPPPPPMPGGGL
jgi:hypothetical protein